MVPKIVSEALLHSVFTIATERGYSKKTAFLYDIAKAGYIDSMVAGSSDLDGVTNGVYCAMVYIVALDMMPLRQRLRESFPDLQS